MTTWRERIARAERRGRWVPRPLRAVIGAAGFALFDRPWPFTGDDLIAWQSAETCLAGETARKYGIDHFTSWPMVVIGVRALDSLVSGDPRGVGRALDAIEDRALQLKREPPLLAHSEPRP